MQRHIEWRQNALCNEKHEPKWWKIWRKASHLRTCVEYDLSLRLRPLGDKGVRSLTSDLSAKDIYFPKDTPGRLRKLDLARQRITRRGAGYLARWISPLEDGSTAAIASHIHINLEGNPISISGRKLLERAVDEARLEGIFVFITGGGPITEPGGRRGFVMAKLGPLELSEKPNVDIEYWRIPVSRWEKNFGRIRSLRMQVMLSLILGILVGLSVRTGTVSSYFEKIFPYRPALVHRDHFTNYECHYDGFILK